jgi:hypothetical protein
MQSRFKGAQLLINAAAVWLGKIFRRRSFSWLDLKIALRMLVRYPGLTLTGGLGIAVAMAIVVGVFSMNKHHFNPTIPLSEGQRMVGLENWDRRTHREERRSLYDFVEWRKRAEIGRRHVRVPGSRAKRDLRRRARRARVAALGPARPGLRIAPSEALKAE